MEVVKQQTARGVMIVKVIWRALGIKSAFGVQSENGARSCSVGHSLGTVNKPYGKQAIFWRN